jgi:hypothetical protein
MPQCSLREKAGLIFRATRTHARNLAKFATIYKATCLLLKHYGATPGKEGKPKHALSLLPPFDHPQSLKKEEKRLTNPQAPTTVSSRAY